MDFEKFDSVGIYIVDFKVFKNLYWEIQRKLTQKKFLRGNLFTTVKHSGVLGSNCHYRTLLGLCPTLNT